MTDIRISELDSYEYAIQTGLVEYRASISDTPDSIAVTVKENNVVIADLGFNLCENAEDYYVTFNASRSFAELMDIAAYAIQAHLREKRVMSNPNGAHHLYMDISDWPEEYLHSIKQLISTYLDTALAKEHNLEEMCRDNPDILLGRPADIPVDVYGSTLSLLSADLMSAGNEPYTIPERVIGGSFKCKISSIYREGDGVMIVFGRPEGYDM